MNEQSMMVRKLASSDFAIWELHMYLDTHPEDQLALEKLREHEEKRQELLALYESKFGPIYSDATGQNTKWTWLQNPWPWDYQEE